MKRPASFSDGPVFIAVRPQGLPDDYGSVFFERPALGPKLGRGAASGPYRFSAES
jgi:hypothetical protein